MKWMLALPLYIKNSFHSNILLYYGILYIMHHKKWLKYYTLVILIKIQYIYSFPLKLLIDKCMLPINCILIKLYLYYRMQEKSIYKL